jgi:repressor LexA
MVEAGILDGDFVVVRQQRTAVNGDIVVAMIDEEATVKRFFREPDGSIRLQPENSTLEPIIVTGGEFSIVGKVVALFRRV